jgi:hypothetical protein
MSNSHPACMLFSTFIGIDLMLMTSAFGSRLQICSAISFGGDIKTLALTDRKLNFTGSRRSRFATSVSFIVFCRQWSPSHVLVHNSSRPRNPLSMNCWIATCEESGPSGVRAFSTLCVFSRPSRLCAFSRPCALSTLCAFSTLRVFVHGSVPSACSADLAYLKRSVYYDRIQDTQHTSFV